MIAEDYCSYEVAKLLKEKGFDEPCDNYYDQSSDEPQQLTLDEMYYSYDEFLKAPTHQMAMKWLREKYNVHVEVRYFPTPNIYRYVIIHSPITFDNIDSHPQYFDKYEEAAEAALKYCLEKLI